MLLLQHNNSALKFLRGIFIFLLICHSPILIAQVSDSNLLLPVDTNQVDSSLLAKPVVSYDSVLARFLSNHTFLKAALKGGALVISPRKDNSRDYLFYLVAGMALMLGCLRYFYARYFTTLFRVFFNSSLRQSQLTDQLLQAKLPSLLFNIFFVIAGGFFIFLMLTYYSWTETNVNWWLFLPACIAAVAIIYTVKYFTLKFTGWVTSYKSPADTYIFIVFLVNKIIGILLVPVIVLIAFSQSGIMKVTMIAAFFVVAILLIFRFFRSYGLLQGQLRLSRTHFFLYIMGVEILPILMIYKGLMIYLNKSL